MVNVDCYVGIVGAISYKSGRWKMKLNSKENSMRREMATYSFVCLMLVILGTFGAVSYKLDGNLELLIFSLAALMSGLVVALAGSLKKDLHDLIENRKAE